MDESADPVVSLQDVIEEDQQLEQIANAVLGGSDDSSCTYSKGYVDRQALYACATCSGSRPPPPTGEQEKETAAESSEGELAGVCLACSLHCHEGHDLYELYTKRHFRCDCGNSKFPDLTCELCPEKDPINSENKYNHNFRGLYCTCDRPYPDSEDEIEDEMLQCCVCEDWFHSRHLGGGDVPEGYEEMVCDRCMASRDFLKPYKLCLVVKVGGGEEGEGEVVVDVTGSEETSQKDSIPVDKDAPLAKNDASCSNTEPGLPGQNVTEPVPPSPEGGAGCGRGGEDQSCELARRRQQLPAVGQPGSEEGAGYFSATWRSQLCRCPLCMSRYTEAHCLFLLEQSDTISSYEARAAALPTAHETAMSAFCSSVDRVHQVEALHREWPAIFRGIIYRATHMQSTMT
jgi:E3 ubiquitin-protein ligase UBR7